MLQFIGMQEMSVIEGSEWWKKYNSPFHIATKFN